jgi:hypothetical protein
MSKSQKRRERDRLQAIRAQQQAARRARKEGAKQPQDALAIPIPAGGQGESVPSSRTELILERAAIRRPHLYGLTQKKREGLANKSLLDALGSANPRVRASAIRNCLIMEAQEQGALDRELKEKQAAEPQGTTTTNVVLNWALLAGRPPAGPQPELLQGPVAANGSEELGERR